MCCPGCEAVAQTIVDSGLEAYYDFRDQPNLQSNSLIPKELEKLARFDNPEEQKSFVQSSSEDHVKTTLVVEGITCAACAWLIEKELGRLDGLQQVSLNLSNHRLNLEWHPEKIKVSEILQALYRLGYPSRPFCVTEQGLQQTKEFRTALKRLVVAGLGMMQVMMSAIGLYAGALEGIEDNYKMLLRWTSFFLTTPVVFYAALPFFHNAYIGLKAKTPVMDLSISIAIGLAYLASAWATINNTGEVYFDSVCMFVFFLSIGRFLEMRSRHKATDVTQNLLTLSPATVNRIVGDDIEAIPLTELKLNDRLLLKAGESVATDGTIVKGDSHLSEAMLTGESEPKFVTIGDNIRAGAVNSGQPITYEVTRLPNESTLNAIVNLLDKAQATKPKLSQIADQIAGYFVLAVITLSAVVYTAWYFVDPEQAFWIMLAVLVVTCPCALSLATPTALTSATNRLAQSGFLLTAGHALQTLPKVTQVIFDKTGTLTYGQFSLEDTVAFTDISKQKLQSYAKSLELYSEHPIAVAFQCLNVEALPVNHFSIATGSGIKGFVDEQDLWLGSAGYIESELGHKNFQQGNQEENLGSQKWIYLANATVVIGAFRITDQVREDAGITIKHLKERGITTTILSGDDQSNVSRVGNLLQVDNALGQLTPEQKLEHLKALQDDNEVILMVGDGINDAPALGHAHLSAAMGSGADLTKTGADIVLLRDKLQSLASAFDTSQLTQSIIKQNIAWAIGYNLSVVPIAALGFIPPYIAALGMSFSSLLVVLNAARIRRS